MKTALWFKALTWPVIAFLIVGGVHFGEEALRSDLQGIFGPPVTGPALLVFGIWVGYLAVRGGGNFVDAIVVGAILGLFPLMEQVVGFGIILDRTVDATIPLGIFTWDMVFWGALIGGGFAMGLKERTA